MDDYLSMDNKTDWLRLMLSRMFRPVSQHHALEIASAAVKDKDQVTSMVCYDTKPDNFRIYDAPDEPCWYISAPWDDEVIAIRNSRVILVGKLTGTILYDGSARDEG